MENFQSFLGDFGDSTMQLRLCQLSNPFMGQFRQQPYVCWLMFADLKDHLEDVVELLWTA